MKIAVTGGKGGTGKSTIATALAAELARKYSVQLVDLDVDCPNDHLILDIPRRKVADVFRMVPEFDKSKCTKCGMCVGVCKSGAVIQVKGSHPIFFPEQCSGCRACLLACPEGAIREGKTVCGHVYRGKGVVDLVSGEMVPTNMEGVSTVKKAKEIANGNYDFTIIDTAAGIHCTVILALMGADFALAVTEPTPLGSHDLGLILDLTKELKIPCEVVINKHGIGDNSSIMEILKEKGSREFGKLPYSKEIVSMYSRGEPVVHPAVSGMARKLEAMMDED